MCLINGKSCVSGESFAIHEIEDSIQWGLCSLVVLKRPKAEGAMYNFEDAERRGRENMLGGSMCEW